MESPSPKPPVARAREGSPRRKRSNTWGSWSGPIPAPASSTTTNAAPPPWVRGGSFGGPGSDFRPGVKVTETGEGFVTGSFSSTAQFGKKVLVSAGDSDIFLDKHGRFGTRRWIVQAGGSGHDEGTDIALDGAGNAYVTGWFTDSATFASTDGSSKRRGLARPSF